MERTYKRGDMYYADLGKGVGSEQEGRRPVLIVQNNTGNRHSTTVIVASISSRADVKPKLPTHCLIDAGCGLQLPSVVLLEQLRTVSKQRLEGYIGRLDKKHIRSVNHALAVSVGLIPAAPTGRMHLCLCGICADNFYNTGAYVLQRIDRGQTEKDVCTYCNQRMGFDYEVIPKTDGRE